MTGGAVTLGHFLIAMAAIELVMVLLMARSALRANPDATPGQRRPIAIIVGAGAAAAIGLCLIALFLPEARIPIF